MKYKKINITICLIMSFLGLFASESDGNLGSHRMISGGGYAATGSDAHVAGLVDNIWPDGLPDCEKNNVGESILQLLKIIKTQRREEVIGYLGRKKKEGMGVESLIYRRINGSSSFISVMGIVFLNTNNSDVDRQIRELPNRLYDEFLGIQGDLSECHVPCKVNSKTSTMIYYLIMRENDNGDMLPEMEAEQNRCPQSDANYTIMLCDHEKKNQVLGDAPRIFKGLSRTETLGFLDRINTKLALLFSQCG